MPNKCCVYNCNKPRGFRFPKDIQLRKQWVVAVRRDKWSPTPNSVVCENHFRPTDFVDGPTAAGSLIRRKRLLKRNVVPSVFHWSQSPSEQNKLQRQRSSKRQRQKNHKSEVTLKQTKAACGSSFDKMDSNDLCVTSGVKIEIDVAEEPPIFWGTVKDHQGQGEAVVMLIPVYT